MLENRQSGSLRIGFAQFSNKLLSDTSDFCSILYTKTYRHMPGYSYNEHFLELPYWINIVSGMFPDDAVRSLIVITSVDVAVKEIQSSENDIVFFSVMNVNEELVEMIASKCPEQFFILGGYTSPGRFADYSNVKYLSNPLELEQIDGLLINPQAPPDYRLFSDGTKWMPRITLSMGCKHKCKFCAVPRTLMQIDEEQIISQARAFKGLNFDLVYIDDKTFGQAANHVLLAAVYDEIRNFNPTFLGFTIQTTATALTDNNSQLLYDCAEKLHVKYIEVGLETADDRLLADLRKPHRLKHVQEVCKGIRDVNIRRSSLPSEAEPETRMPISFIPNIMFGIRGDDYKATLSFMKGVLDITPTFNYANLSAYPDRRTEEYLESKTAADADDYSFDKSWLDPGQVSAGKRALEQLGSMFGVEATVL